MSSVLLSHGKLYLDITKHSFFYLHRRWSYGFGYQFVFLQSFINFPHLLKLLNPIKIYSFNMSSLLGGIPLNIGLMILKLTLTRYFVIY